MSKPDTLRMKPKDGPSTGSFRAKPCPVCNRLSIAAFHPFCSARCTDVDLHRWLGGGYALPSNAVEDDDDQVDIEKDGHSS